MPIESTSLGAEALSARPNETLGITTVNIRRTAAAALAGLALAGATQLAPASAADTPVSLTVTATGGIALTVPAPPSGSTHVNLGSVAAGSALAETPNSLGVVTVTDTRTGILSNNWVASVSASNLVLDGDPANATTVGKFIPAASLGYATGSVTEVAAPTAPPVVVPTLASLAAPLPVVTTVSLGPNTLSWNPKLVVTVLPNTLPGAYQGAVTHSIL